MQYILGNINREFVINCFFSVGYCPLINKKPNIFVAGINH